MEKGKQSKEYFDACSVIEMNELDMLMLGIEENTPVLVKSECGQVVVTAIVGLQILKPGMCHIRLFHVEPNQPVFHNTVVFRSLLNRLEIEMF